MLDVRNVCAATQQLITALVEAQPAGIQAADYSHELSPFPCRTRSVPLLFCSPLHNQPPYATLCLVATSILILIVARFLS